MAAGQLPPTLGPLVADWIEANCVHGPGEVIGRPAQLTDDHLLFLYRLFELRPDGRRKYRRACYSRPKGSAKDLALDTPIPTAGGWKTQGSLVVGDIVFDERGERCRVTAVHPVRHETCYRLTFSDGTSIVAGATHPWPVIEFTNGRASGDPSAVRLGPRRTGGASYVHRTVPTADLAAAGVTFDRPLSKGRTKATRAGVARWRTLPTPCLDLPDADLPIPPWVLGLWLGDGRRVNSSVTVGDKDLAEVEGFLEMDGVPFHREKRYEGRAQQLWLEGMNPLLRDLGVLGDKRIPEVYLRGSEKQRLLLLQGLMDSDGSAGKKRRGAVFVNTNRALVEGVLDLARGLGLNPRISERRAVLRGKDCGPVWAVSINAYRDTPVFRLPRKADLLLPRPPGRAAFSGSRTITAVEEVPTVPTRCITVDSPSHLYLAGEGLVPTHNTELAAWIALAEALGPTRCGGFDGEGDPVGVPAVSPDIMCLATEEGQAGLAYSVIHVNLTQGPLAATPGLDAGLTRSYLPGGGIIRAGSSGAASKDGMRPTMLIADETHLMTLPELKELHATAWRGIFKRPDALLLETTTAFRPGQGSVAEAAYETYRTLSGQSAERLGVLYDHRGATCTFDALADPDARMAALLEAYGPAAQWMQLEELAGAWDLPDTNHVDWARYWANMVVASADSFLDQALWDARSAPGRALADGDAVCLGLDTALRDDATALVACRASDGHLVRLGCWQRPEGRDGVDWITPFGEVDAAVREAFARFRVLRLYCDPQYAESLLDAWTGDFGQRVFAWPTNRAVPMEAALRRFWVAARTGDGLSHDGDPLLAAHVGNARTVRSKGRTIVGKDRPHSPRKIDLLIAAVLAFEAAADARAAGEDRPARRREYRAAGF